jgi:hypothetical protein
MFHFDAAQRVFVDRRMGRLKRPWMQLHYSLWEKAWDKAGNVIDTRFP